MPQFTPPTVKQPVGTGPLLSRYSIDVGQSVVKADGHFTLMPFPWKGDIDGLVEGVEWFRGGCSYAVTDDVAAALEADGFTTTDDAGYGVGPYGQEGFGY